MKDQQLSASYQTLVNRTNPKLMTHDDQNPYSSKLILIIDSVPEMQRALTMTLASFGANKVEFATRPGDAMAKLARYSLISCCATLTWAMATTACTCWKKPKHAICSSNPACS